MKSALVIAGPSAVGKTTVAEKIIEISGGGFELSRSLTTRQRRGDAFDDEYIYTTREGFEKELSNGRVLEHTEYSGELYGTPLSEIERISDSGKTPILILDLNGVKNVSQRADALKICAVYLYCDNETLQKRLYSRYLCSGFTEEGEKMMKKRLEENRRYNSVIGDFTDCFYDFLDNNGTPLSTAERILSVFFEFASGKAKDGKKNSEVAENIRLSAKSE